MLFFDEADALFTTRVKVETATDEQMSFMTEKIYRTADMDPELLARLSRALAKVEPPDAGALRDYCERLDAQRHPAGTSDQHSDDEAHPCSGDEAETDGGIPPRTRAHRPISGRSVRVPRRSHTSTPA